MNKEQMKEYFLNKEKQMREWCYENMSSIPWDSEDEHQREAESTYQNYVKHFDDELSCCEESVCGIDLHDYLERIRHNDYETEVVLFIKDGVVVDEYIVNGGHANVKISAEQFDEIFQRAKDLGAGIYSVHNHPYSIAAIPSGGVRKYKDMEPIETGDYRTSHTILPEHSKKYGVEVLDVGVVTEFDYYSMKQKKEKNNEKEK